MRTAAIDSTIRIITLGFVVLISTSCAMHSFSKSHYLNPKIDFNMSVAILPLENLTVHPNAGITAQQLLATELYQRKLFNIREETHLRHSLVKHNVDMDQFINLAHAQQIGKQLKVDAVIIGTVSEYGYQYGLREEPTVGLNLRLVLAENSEVIWAASHSAVGRGYLGRESVNKTAQIVIASMIDTLVPVAK